MDLSRYSLENIILSALKSEIDSRDLYNTLAGRVKNAFLKDRFLFLANEEEKHRHFFEDLYRNNYKRDPIIPSSTPVPLPVFPPKLEELQISEIISVAMEAEISAREFYLAMANLFEDASTKEFLNYIASMELTHYKILEIEKENSERFEAYDFEFPMMHIGP